MKIYLVGGAVRDQLLGHPVTERDFVVVGATPQTMLDLGFKQVGSDFPVFLHPQTQEEYALARTERKTGHGYTGFECHADPSVTLEQDLARRDLTINAMAQECPSLPQTDDTPAATAIIDPFGGQQDLQSKVLRHVSLAFAEDPVRILRIARFAARFPDFHVDNQTNELMKSMVAAGEVAALVPERVWKEFSRALTAQCPWRFFEVLNDCEALQPLFPELYDHQNWLEPLKNRCSAAASAALDNAQNATQTALLNYGALALGLNPADTAKLSQRLRVPTQFSDLAQLIATHLTRFLELNSQDPATVIEFLERLDAYRRPERFHDFCNSISQGADDNGGKAQRAARLLVSAHQQTKAINAALFENQGLQGEAIGKAIHQQRVKQLQESLKPESPHQF